MRGYAYNNDTPTLFDILVVDLNYIPDDGTSTQRFINTSETWEEGTENYDLSALGIMVWRSIEDHELLKDLDIYRKALAAWRRGCVDKLENTLEGLFPGRWEMQYTGNDLIESGAENVKIDLGKAKGDATKLTNDVFNNEYARCYIHFPEILITNSLNQQWTILDYYVVMCFSNKMAVNWIKGFRATKIPVEYNAHYTFSHSKVADNCLCRFCFGHTDLDTLVAGLAIGVYDEINIELFLQNLTDYLSWESRDGVPFYFINELINLRYGKGRQPPLPSSIFNRIYEDVLDSREDVEVEISLHEGKFSVHVPITYKLIDIVTKYTPEELLFPIESLTHTSIYPLAQVMSDSDILALNYGYAKDPVFKFKGKNVVLNILQDKKEEKDEREKYADMRLVKEIASHLSMKINEFMYEYSWTGIRKKDLPAV